MHQTSGLLCAEEWPDFTDADGKTSVQLKEFLHDRIVHTLKQFITHNVLKRMLLPIWELIFNISGCLPNSLKTRRYVKAL